MRIGVISATKFICVQEKELMPLLTLNFSAMIVSSQIDMIWNAGTGY